ncbi:MAG TPA: phospholipid carrier-dependent glycosyltransferase [Thermomicrobiales bacterium]|nr:phospholipid carrier-dependent glycosyltransferase [Thermomicrobiales bacterium]
MLATETQRQATATRTRLSLFSIGLPIVVLLAAGLRLWSIDFGLPLVTHPDEPLIFDAADRMISGRTLNPGWFRYPAFIIDIQAIILTIVYTLDKAIGLSPDTIRSLGYGTGRVVMASFGIATVALTGLVGRRLARRTLATGEPRQAERLASVAGLVAAVMLAVSFIHIKDSHYLKPDIPTGFFTTLTLWFTLVAWERAREPHPNPSPTGRGLRNEIQKPLPAGEELGWGFLAAGAAVGLAAAAKYTGAVVAIVPIVALWLLLREQRVSMKQAARIAVRMAVVSIAVFLLINPYVLLAPGEFLSPVDGIRAELEHYRTGHDGAEGNDSWRWYLAELWRNGFGPTLTPLVLLGGVMAVRQLVVDRQKEQDERSGSQALWLVLVFLPVYYAMIARYPVRFDRQLIPILPYLALLGGFGVAASLALLDRADRTRLVTGTVAVLLLVGVLATPLTIRAADWNIETGKPDTRYVALKWIEEHVPPGATIIREWHTPPVAQVGYGDIFIRAAYEQPLDWYRASGAEYLVISSFMYARYLDAPETYPTEAAFYVRLFAIPPAATFDGANGPELYIYRLDDAAPAFE